MKILIFTVMLAAALSGHGQEAPRVYVASKSTGNTWAALRDQTQEIAKDLAKDCSEVGITVNPQQYDYQVELNHLEIGYFVRDNQIAITDMFGNVLSTLETDSIKKGVKRACALIRADWSNQASARPKLVNGINTLLQKDGALGYAEILGNRLTVHSERASSMRFHMVLANERQLSYLRRAGVATFYYTNDADQNFMYDVNSAQVISPAPQQTQAAASTAATSKGPDQP